MAAGFPFGLRIGRHTTLQLPRRRYGKASFSGDPISSRFRRFAQLIDWRNVTLPVKQIEVTGNIALSFFLCMALMSMRLWKLAAIAGPMLAILWCRPWSWGSTPPWSRST